MLHRRPGYLVVFVCCAILVLTAAVCQAGMVTLVFDDGLESVRQFAFPVLSRHGLVATTAVIAGRVDSGDPDFMTSDELRELQRAGWEVASHGLTHKRPIDIPQRYGDERCLTLRPVASRPGLFEGKYGYEKLAGLMEGDTLLRERASGRLVEQEPGTYYFDGLISEVIVHPYVDADAPAQKIVAVSYERELAVSQKRLAALGLDVTTYVTPHNYWTNETCDLSRKTYAQVAAGGDDCNRKGTTDRHWLKRFVVHTDDSAASIIEMIKKHAVEEDAWVIFCLHGVGSDLGWEPWAANKLDTVAAFLQKERIPVVTLAQGARRWFAGQTTASAK